MMLPVEFGSFKFRNANSWGSLKLKHYTLSQMKIIIYKL